MVNREEEEKEEKNNRKISANEIITRHRRPILIAPVCATGDREWVNVLSGLYIFL